MFQISIPFKNIWVIVKKQNFNQNFNLIQGKIIWTIHATIALCSTSHISLLMFQISINSIQNIRVIVREQNFNQNFNPIVDAAPLPTGHTDQRQSISWNFSLKNLAKNYFEKENLKNTFFHCLNEYYYGPTGYFNASIWQHGG